MEFTHSAHSISRLHWGTTRNLLCRGQVSGLWPARVQIYVTQLVAQVRWDWVGKRRGQPLDSTTLQTA